MPKPKRVFICRSCGSAQPRWLGKCPDCNAWDALEEEIIDPSSARSGAAAAGVSIAAALHQGGPLPPAHAEPARALSDAEADTPTPPRLPTGIHEFDRVLGLPTDAGPAGLVPGSVVLVGGEPGIGKSTLLLQAAAGWAARGKTVLYVSSEESAEQIRMRARRLGAVGGGGGGDAASRLFVLAETILPRIIEQIRRVAPAVLIIDSVQMLSTPEASAAPGSVTQLRRCAAELATIAKISGLGVLLVGHVTKEGELAGPRVLEHMVDAVLYFEGDRYHAHRVVRAVKNRFGTTMELGLFGMTGAGLEELPDGAGSPASDAPPRPGTVPCPVLSGTRAVLVEIQALTATGFLGAAKRKCSGLDPSRLAMIIAVLEQHAELRLADRDVFASSAGGVRVAEPAADLSLLLAIAGAHYRRALGERTAAVGEVGLGGELRPVPQFELRCREAAKLGYKALIVPAAHTSPPRGIDLELRPARTIDRAIEMLG